MEIIVMWLDMSAFHRPMDRIFIVSEEIVKKSHKAVAESKLDYLKIQKDRIEKEMKECENILAA
jgi:hypothetical protein